MNGCAELHEGLTCDQYENIMKKEGKGFINIMLKDHIKICGKCGAWIEKMKGCNHITCKCSNEFCYLCGLKWKTCKCQLYGREGEILSNDEEFDEEEEIPFRNRRRLEQRAPQLIRRNFHFSNSMQFSNSSESDYD